MNLESVRLMALSHPEVTEEPHFAATSFRVRGKIFVTVPPEGTHIHVFVAEEAREPMLAMYPDDVEKLFWGKKVVGLRVILDRAQDSVVEDLIRQAWVNKAPKTLRAQVADRDAS